MDDKYQDIHIKNWKTHKESIYREVQIKEIEIKDTQIMIKFIDYNEFTVCLIFDKKYNSLLID